MTGHQYTVITIGVSSSTGRTVAERLQADYNHVACFDIETDETDWGDEGTHELVADVRDPDAVADTVVTVESTVNVVAPVNNVGISRAASLADFDPDGWDRVLDVNLKGRYVITRTIIPGMVECGEGIIVNVSNVAGLPLERIGVPEEVADVVAPLCNGMGYVAGTALTADNGPMFR